MNHLEVPVFSMFWFSKKKNQSTELPFMLLCLFGKSLILVISEEIITVVGTDNTVTSAR